MTNRHREFDRSLRESAILSRRRSDGYTVHPSLRRRDFTASTPFKLKAKNAIRESGDLEAQNALFDAASFDVIHSRV